MGSSPVTHVTFAWPSKLHPVLQYWRGLCSEVACSPLHRWVSECQNHCAFDWPTFANAQSAKPGPTSWSLGKINVNKSSPVQQINVVVGKKAPRLATYLQHVLQLLRRTFQSFQSNFMSHHLSWEAAMHPEHMIKRAGWRD